jgi:hypothetical protein
MMRRQPKLEPCEIRVELLETDAPSSPFGALAIVGFKREEAWTLYACQSAASFSAAFRVDLCRSLSAGVEIDGFDGDVSHDRSAGISSHALQVGCDRLTVRRHSGRM